MNRDQHQPGLAGPGRPDTPQQQPSRPHRPWFTKWLPRGLGLGEAIALAAVLWVVGTSVYYGIPALIRARVVREKTACMENVKTLGRALLMYLGDNDQVLPPSGAWCDSLAPDLPDAATLVCPAARNGLCSYAFSAAAGGTKLTTITDPNSAVAIFESDAGWNAAGGPELLPGEPRHYGGDDYVFCGGGSAWRSRKRLGADSRGNPIWAKEPDADWVIWEPVLKETEGAASQ